MEAVQAVIPPVVDTMEATSPMVAGLTLAAGTVVELAVVGMVVGAPLLLVAAVLVGMAAATVEELRLVVATLVAMAAATVAATAEVATAEVAVVDMAAVVGTAVAVGTTAAAGLPVVATLIVPDEATMVVARVAMAATTRGWFGVCGRFREAIC